MKRGADAEIRQALNQEFGAMVPVRDFSKKYLGLGAKASDALCCKREIGFKVFRLGSQLSPWVADAADVAKFVAERRG